MLISLELWGCWLDFWFMNDDWLDGNVWVGVWLCGVWCSVCVCGAWYSVYGLWDLCSMCDVWCMRMMNDWMNGQRTNKHTTWWMANNEQTVRYASAALATDPEKSACVFFGIQTNLFFDVYRHFLFLSFSLRVSPRVCVYLTHMCHGYTLLRTSYRISSRFWCRSYIRTR